MQSGTHDPQNSYDRVASEYARQFFRELEDKPKDREILERFAAAVKGSGTTCDMGCGPGEIARYLKDQGVDMVGVDLSPKMIEEASRLSPDIPFHQGNMMHLDIPDNTWSGIAAFYSIIHIPRAQVVDALRELRRVLKPGGLLLLTFHVGNNVEHVEQWLDQQVSVDFYFFETVEMVGYLTSAGFENIDPTERDPYPDVEYQSRRTYIFARKPSA